MGLILNTHDLLAHLLGAANTVARQEITTALTAPHRNLINLLHNRSENLAYIAAEEASFNDVIEQLSVISEKWGMF